MRSPPAGPCGSSTGRARCGCSARSPWSRSARWGRGAGLERDDGRPTGRLFRLDGWLHGRLPPASAGSGRRRTAVGLFRRDRRDRLHAPRPPTTSNRRRCRPHRALPLTVSVTGGPDLARPPHPRRLRRGPVKFLITDHAFPSLEDLSEAFAHAHRAGRPVAVHCVTRAGLLLALAAWREVGSAPGDRIEHGSVMPLEVVATLRELSLTVVTQPAFLAARGDAFSPGRASDRPDLYRCASFQEAGVAVGGSTDTPFGPDDPWVAMRAAMERRAAAGRGSGRTGLRPRGPGLFSARRSTRGGQAGGSLPGRPRSLPPRRAAAHGAPRTAQRARRGHRCRGRTLLHRLRGGACGTAGAGRGGARAGCGRCSDRGRSQGDSDRTCSTVEAIVWRVADVTAVARRLRRVQPSMASEGLHEQRELLGEETVDYHRAMTSLGEELEAIDWYDQRVNATSDASLAAVLAHNRDDEKEHAAMTLEWIRRRDPAFDAELRKFLFTTEPITEVGTGKPWRRGSPPECGVRLVGHREPQGSRAMNHLHRDLAPISDTDWALIDDEAKGRLTTYLAARKLVDFDGPHGWGTPPPTWAGSGRCRGLRRGWRRPTARSCPWSSSGPSSRSPRCSWTTATAVPSTSTSTNWTRRYARSPSGRTSAFSTASGPADQGHSESASHPPIVHGSNIEKYPNAVAMAVDALRQSGIGGPYGIAICPETVRRDHETTERGGYLLFDHLHKILGGQLVWTPGIDGAVVLSPRGGASSWTPERICPSALSIATPTLYGSTSKRASAPGPGARRRGGGPSQGLRRRPGRALGLLPRSGGAPRCRGVAHHRPVGARSSCARRDGPVLRASRPSAPAAATPAGYRQYAATRLCADFSSSPGPSSSGSRSPRWHTSSARTLPNGAR